MYLNNPMQTKALAELEEENRELRKELMATQAKLIVCEANLKALLKRLIDPRGLHD